MFLGPARVTAFSSSPLQLVVSFTSVEKWFHFRLEVFFSLFHRYTTRFSLKLDLKKNFYREKSLVNRNPASHIPVVFLTFFAVSLKIESIENSSDEHIITLRDTVVYKQVFFSKSVPYPAV